MSERDDGEKRGADVERERERESAIGLIDSRESRAYESARSRIEYRSRANE